MVDYAQEQQEELEAIESIYSEEIDIIGDGPHRFIISIYWSLVDLIKHRRPNQRNRVFATNSDFPIPISLKPIFLELGCFNNYLMLLKLILMWIKIKKFAK